MQLVTIGLGPTATLTGFLLFGLSVPPAVPTPEEECTPIVEHVFGDEPGPVYPVTNQPGFWRSPAWTPPPYFSYDPATAEYPDTLLARNVDVIGGELTYINSPPTFALSVFGELEGSTYHVVQFNLGHEGLRKVYAECGLNFHKTLFDGGALQDRPILTTYPADLFRASFQLVMFDEDGPPSNSV